MLTNESIFVLTVLQGRKLRLFSFIQIQIHLGFKTHSDSVKLIYHPESIESRYDSFKLF